MTTLEIAAVVADLEREVRALREEVDALKRHGSTREARIEQFAGLFTGDAAWTAIHEAIENARREPDPELSSVPSCGSGTQT